MSRSYKKTPYCGDHKGKQKKRMANSKIRSLLKDLEIELQHNQYKKAYCSYDICDFYWIIPYKEYKKKNLKYFENEKECYKWWYKHYKMK